MRKLLAALVVALLTLLPGAAALAALPAPTPVFMGQGPSQSTDTGWIGGSNAAGCQPGSIALAWAMGVGGPVPVNFSDDTDSTTWNAQASQVASSMKVYYYWRVVGATAISTTTHFKVTFTGTGVIHAVVVCLDQATAFGGVTLTTTGSGSGANQYPLTANSPAKVPSYQAVALGLSGNDNGLTLNSATNGGWQQLEAEATTTTAGLIIFWRDAESAGSTYLKNTDTTNNLWLYVGGEFDTASSVTPPNTGHGGLLLLRVGH